MQYVTSAKESAATRPRIRGNQSSSRIRMEVYHKGNWPTRMVGGIRPNGGTATQYLLALPQHRLDETGLRGGVEAKMWPRMTEGRPGPVIARCA